MPGQNCGHNDWKWVRGTVGEDGSITTYEQCRTCGAVRYYGE